MQTPPDGLSPDRLARALTEMWGLVVASIEYLPVGFGSHHWVAVEPGGTTWFVTVDDLDAKQLDAGETRDAGFGRLRAALATAVDLYEAGVPFVVAPMPTRSGAPLVRLDARFAGALYPYVAGRRFSWGDALTHRQRGELLDLVVALHSTPTRVTPHVITDQHGVPYRDVLEAALDRSLAGWDDGPYGRATLDLVVESSAALRRVLGRFDDLVLGLRALEPALVVTHGEPHPGNTMATSGGFVLIDWDTVLLAPPERDLWIMDPGDGSILEAYTAATGTALGRPTLELYRVWWDLADLSAYVARFRRRHTGTEDDLQSWGELRSLITRLTA
jgi:spectinomycin phosphotransferase/16S rRNA (guanine(1405)-N(7))-methyltransferase